MSFEGYAIGGLSVIVLVLGIVEAAKRWGLPSKASEGLAFGLGFFFVALTVAIERALIPAGWVPYIEIVVTGLGGALAATGIYDLVRKQAIEMSTAIASEMAGSREEPPFCLRDRPR